MSPILSADLIEMPPVSKVIDLPTTENGRAGFGFRVSGFGSDFLDLPEPRDPNPKPDFPMLQHNHPRRVCAPLPHARIPPIPSLLHLAFVHHANLQPHFLRELLRDLRQRWRIDHIPRPRRDRAAIILPLGDDASALDAGADIRITRKNRHLQRAIVAGIFLFGVFLLSRRPLVFLELKPREHDARDDRIRRDCGRHRFDRRGSLIATRWMRCFRSALASIPAAWRIVSAVTFSACPSPTA
jgi:hypothetical protein